MKTTLKTLIIDDEVRSRSILRTMISRYCPDISVYGEASSIDEGLQLVTDTAPELIFLDVELGLGTGFDMLGQVSNINFQTIFVTAYDTFAIKAIKWSAQDYLLKPVDPVELVASVNKAVKVVHQKNAHASTDEHPALQSKTIGLPAMEGLHFVNIEDIIRCEAKGAYTEFIFANNKKLLVSKTLQTYEDILCPYGFLRVHHAHLINLNQIREYIKGRGGNIVMADGAVITVSVRKKEEFLKHILH